MENRDEIFMERAIRLARRGRYGAHPNPMVGAVLVRGGRIIGEGWHKEFGGPHAEVNAIRSSARSGRGARGAVMYVTLEPCSTSGKTGPCTGALIAAGVERVVIGAGDPNPANSGRAAAILSAAGIKVRSGVLAREAEDLNPAFNKFMRTGLPYVTLKIAQSLDGRIADFKGRSRWITSPSSRAESHRLRAEADAVLVGINTVRSDDPSLTVRHVRTRRQPSPVVLDSRLQLPLSASLLAGNHPVVAATGKAPARRAVLLRRGGAEVLILPSDRSTGGVDLKSLLKALGRRGISHVLVEGGGRVIGSFLRRGLFDRFMIFSAPLLIGGEKAKPSVSWPDAPAVRGALGIRTELRSIRRIGPDILTEVRPL
ncbi:MAG TPA: bifunctional diaminohydroxyphosphoribosylaminopyrimidine deaminase/5-amino-6-(5-phosphoribosylamino)uracil reductase RibD [Elusimicrobiales bacterium]|nr:bifunctional diaminohydroxyphosphoribosylaminopyrimidine deaminase/5-amino-6-(5-phosphoribosylamino)uracil reductase RibD [Elusimicrobiales bacterium]